MGKIVRPVTQDEIQQAKQQALVLAESAQVGVQAGQFVFFAAFDGTNNDRNNTMSGSPKGTNVDQLMRQVDDQKPLNPNLETQYYPGPGTNGPLDPSSWL